MAKGKDKDPNSLKNQQKTADKIAKQTKPVLKDQAKKDPDGFREKFGLPKKKSSIIGGAIILGAALSLLSHQPVEAAQMQAQMTKRDWIRICLRNCDRQWQGVNDWQLRRCRQDCRGGNGRG
jgi:hypothetical protein